MCRDRILCPIGRFIAPMAALPFLGQVAGMITGLKFLAPGDVFLQGLAAAIAGVASGIAWTNHIRHGD